MEDSFYNAFTKKIAQYFDHQLNTEDEQEFLSQLKQDPAGQQSFLKEKNIREKLRVNLHKSTRTGHLADQIKDQIRKYPGQ
ncbi:MAG: hypothetical protein IPO78_16045 [Saprospiraceae bacterium]|nr:hypothetical protein [Saprospiraceae bacterium]MBK8451012.1 hypothetical protein [Saprospiraceae bacterium]MBK8485740.1 hypothetical protein [Saprospiraceae bacterium]MBK9222966.1 hypothetical protein [Saprospiraceae bacterium]MBK9723104.1 hypothetical protein [Saprospiraceae bacterium]